MTPLDVLDDYFGGLPGASVAQSLTLSQVDDLGDRVNTTATQMSKMKPSPDPIGDLVYPGGWLANGWQHGIFRNELNCALLYEPRLLVHDPLAEYFFSDFNLLPQVTMKGARELLAFPVQECGPTMDDVCIGETILTWLDWILRGYLVYSIGSSRSFGAA